MEKLCEGKNILSRFSYFNFIGILFSSNIDFNAILQESIKL